MYAGLFKDPEVLDGLTPQQIDAAVLYVETSRNNKDFKSLRVYDNKADTQVTANHIIEILDKVWLGGNVSPSTTVLLFYATKKDRLSHVIKFFCRL